MVVGADADSLETQHDRLVVGVRDADDELCHRVHGRMDAQRHVIDDRVLSMLDKRAEGVSATIHTRYNEHFLTDLNKHNTQYPSIKFVQLPLRNHDRFLIIDGKVYLGASLKDMGVGLCAITEMNATPESILGLVTSQ